MNKKGFELSFSWLFGIIVGAVILFIAIYAAVSFVGLSRTRVDTSVAAQLGVLLNPVETNLESGKYIQIQFTDETRVLNRCSESGNFGEQGIRTSVRSRIGKEWQTPGFESIFYNKYMFSSKTEEGAILHVFVKPFEMPYKVADLVFATSEKYCFVNPPAEIEEEVSDLKIQNINLSSSSQKCPQDSKIVCFGATGCDVDVNVGTRAVVKEGKTVYYEGNSLLYGAIFSDAEIYECQVRRLMKRTAELAHLYASKSNFLSGKGCETGLASDLVLFASQTQINSTAKLDSVEFYSKELGRKNELLTCKLF